MQSLGSDERKGVMGEDFQHLQYVKKPFLEVVLESVHEKVSVSQLRMGQKRLIGKVPAPRLDSL